MVVTQAADQQQPVPGIVSGHIGIGDVLHVLVVAGEVGIRIRRIVVAQFRQQFLVPLAVVDQREARHAAQQRRPRVKVVVERGAAPEVVEVDVLPDLQVAVLGTGGQAESTRIGVDVVAEVRAQVVDALLGIARRDIGLRRIELERGAGQQAGIGNRHRIGETVAVVFVVDEQIARVGAHSPVDLAVMEGLFGVATAQGQARTVADVPVEAGDGATVAAVPAVVAVLDVDAVDLRGAAVLGLVADRKLGVSIQIRLVHRRVLVEPVRVQQQRCVERIIRGLPLKLGGATEVGDEVGIGAGAEVARRTQAVPALGLVRTRGAVGEVFSSVVVVVVRLHPALDAVA